MECGDDTEKIGVTVTAMTPEAFGTDTYVINAATIAGDTLHLNVSYGGGCETHEFTLVAEPGVLRIVSRAAARVARP